MPDTHRVPPTGRLADLDPDQIVDIRDDDLDYVVKVRAELLEALG